MCYIIGIDIGTTHTKAVLLNDTGRVIQESKAGYPSFHPQPGYSEQDPETIWQAVVTVIEKTVSQIENKHEIGCLSFSAAMHSVLAIDKSGKPLTPGITWADTRSEAYAESLQQTERGKRIYQHTGTPIHPMSPLCKIAWIRDHLPDVFAHTATFLSIKEYIIYRLTGALLIDYSIASATGLFDNKHLAWNPESLAFAGITANQLSLPVSPYHRIPLKYENGFSIKGLPENCTIILGAGDGCLANLGSGAVLNGEAAVTIGTSGAVRKFSTLPVKASHQQLFNYLVDQDTFLCGGAINNGGILLQWFANAFIKPDFSGKKDFDSYMEEAATIAAGSEGLIFLPYVYGERAPVWDAQAKGVFFGISAIHQKAHFMRAVLEAICFALREISLIMELEGEPIHTLYASGGFIESPIWLQMMADIFNKDLKVCYAADASAMGAAYLGMKAMGMIVEWKDVKPMIDTGHTFVPNHQNHLVYNKNFKTYCGLYQKLKSDF